MTTTEPRRLGNRYEVGEVLGRGGMAEVHRGQDIRLGRTVAVKTLRNDLARDPTFQARFRREAQSAAALNHPAIVAVYDTGEDHVDGLALPYIVMEYVEGYTLRELLHSDRRLLPERALEITAGVLQALDYSHRQGIIHRDIKPANVMLTSAGDVKVMDFGIARAVADTASTMTATAAVIGTAQYLSPEQARGERVDARSDLYSTGCLLYELLTGRPPFIGDSPVAVAYQHVRENPVPPSHYDADITPEMDAVVMKALAKHPDNRYQTAAEMRADIDRILAGRPVLATPVLAESTQRIPAVDTAAAAATSGYDDGPPPRRRALAYVLLTLAVLGVFALAAFAGRTLLADSRPAQVGVPTLEGLTVEEARTTLEAAGLLLGSQTTENSNTIEAGRIIDQEPAANTDADEGSRVDVTVSAGTATVEVPEVEGLSQDRARARLEQAGFTVAVSRRDDPNTREGEVIGSTPGAGEEAPRGSRVTLLVATGNSRVPNVVGKSESEATAELDAAGFDVSTQRARDGSVPAGRVITQSPKAGEAVRIGDRVTIVVSEGAAPTPAPTPTPTPTPALTPTLAPTTPPAVRPTPAPTPAAQGPAAEGNAAQAPAAQGNPAQAPVATPAP